MKRVVIIVLAMLSLIGSVRAAVEGDEAARKANAKLAVQLVVNSVRKYVQTWDLEAPLQAMLSGNKDGKYTEADKAREILRVDARRYLEKKYLAAVDVALSKADETVPENRKSWFTEAEVRELRRPPPAIEECIKAKFEDACKAARVKAVAEQQSQITRAAYPSEKEFDETERQALRNVLVDRSIAILGMNLFAENKFFLESNYVDRILDDAEKQRKGQRELVSASEGGLAALPHDIAPVLQKELDEHIADLRKSKASEKITYKVYGVFPTVKASLKPQSEELALAKLRKAMSERTIDITGESLKAIISNDLKAHATLERSKEACMGTARDAVKRSFGSVYASRFAAEKQRPVSEFAGAAIATESFKSDVEGLAARSLMKPLDSARKELSEGQFKEFFRPLSSGLWVPSAKDVEDCHARQEASLREPLLVSGISSGKLDPALLLDETRKLVGDAEAVALREGMIALAGQLQLVAKAGSELKTEVAKAAAPPSLEELLATYTKRVAADWTSTRYPSLFPRIADDIRKNARDILELESRSRIALKKSQEEAKLAAQERQEAARAAAAGREGSGGGSGGGGGSGEGDGRLANMGEVAPDLILDFGLAADVVTVTVKVFDKKTKKTTAIYEAALDSKVSDPGAYEEQIGALQRVFETWIAAAVAEGDRKSAKEFFALARVFSGRVNYASIIGLRRCLKKAYEKTAPDNTKIYWLDDYFEKPAVPPDFKLRSMPLLAA